MPPGGPSSECPRHPPEYRVHGQRAYQRRFTSARADATLPTVAVSTTLKDELDQTLLAAESEPESYVPLARDWLARLAYERSPQPAELENAARLLAGVGDGSIPPIEAAAALERTVRG